MCFVMNLLRERELSVQLASHASVVGSHHIGASTAQASRAIADGVVDTVLRFEAGNPLNCVNEDLLEMEHHRLESDI